jgi:peptidyl-prolyl cis-trans isomerase B (cyclophilin B)
MVNIGFRKFFQVFFALSLFILIGCSGLSGSSNASQDSTKLDSIISQADTQTLNPAFIKLPSLAGSATVEMKLKNGTVVMELDGINAPITAGNFVDLAKRGVYNNLTFHRVIREPSPFVAQGGDPLGNGTGSFIDPVTSQPRLIPLEITLAKDPKPQYSKTFKPDELVKLRHTRGAVAMARSQDPDSASSQFYIALADVNFLDGSYAVFGYVKSGMDVVDKINLGDRIESMTVTKGIENLKVPTK